MSRATAGHAASIGASGALSFATGDLIASYTGGRRGFVLGKNAPSLWSFMSLVAERHARGQFVSSTSLYDFRPVLEIDLL